MSVIQTINLDVIPQKDPPHVRVTEYDLGTYGWEIQVNLTKNGTPFLPASGSTAKVEGTTKGGTGFSEDATIDDDVVSFTLTESMTAFKGSAWCKIVITKGTSVMSTSGFWLDCDRAGVEADTVIGAPGFDEKIQDAVDSYLAEIGIHEFIVHYNAEMEIIDATYSAIETALTAGKTVRCEITCGNSVFYAPLTRFKDDNSVGFFSFDSTMLALDAQAMWYAHLEIDETNGVTYDEGTLTYFT